MSGNEGISTELVALSKRIRDKRSMLEAMGAVRPGSEGI